MATMTEIEYLDRIDNELQRIFNMAATARDDAQLALEAVQTLKQRLLERKLELHNEQNWQRFASEPATTRAAWQGRDEG